MQKDVIECIWFSSTFLTQKDTEIPTILKRHTSIVQIFQKRKAARSSQRE